MASRCFVVPSSLYCGAPTTLAVKGLMMMMMCQAELVGCCRVSQSFWQEITLFVFSGHRFRLTGFCFLNQSTESQRYTCLDKKLASFESVYNRTHMRSVDHANVVGSVSVVCNRRYVHIPVLERQSCKQTLFSPPQGVTC